jgi:hypothetical protein
MKRGTLLLPLLFCTLPLFAQEAQVPPEAQASSGDVSSDYRLDRDGKIYQRISWTRANAYFHEIEIEKVSPEGTWVPELTQRTDQTFVELSLPPGMYRYRILSYNVLGRVGAVSDWKGIRVFAAKEPAAAGYSPASYFVDSLEGECTLTITGNDLVEDAQVYLIAKKEGAKPVEPVSIRYGVDTNSLVAVFRTEGLSLGAYDIVITNPGGLSQVLEGFSVGFESPRDINVSLGYAPFLPLYGYLFDTYDVSFYPLGFYGRISVVPIKRLWGWLGIELSTHYADMGTEHSAYSLSGRMVSVYADALYQRWNSSYTLALNLRLGSGLSILSNIKFSHQDGSQSETVGRALFAINAGASAYWLVWKSVFIEAGVEYVHLFSPQSPAPGFIIATIALGKRF